MSIFRAFHNSRAQAYLLAIAPNMCKILIMVPVLASACYVFISVCVRAQMNSSIEMMFKHPATAGG